MNIEKQDLEFSKIVQNILNNEEFMKIKNIEHHGVTRFDHSMKVAYYSYKISKMLHLDYVETARGGLLHDFFISPANRTAKDKFISTFVHPKEAVKTAKSQFNLSRKEEDMIRSHMFPLSLSVPKYAETWVISMVDKWVAVNELSLKLKFKVKYAYNLLLLFIVGIIR